MSKKNVWRVLEAATALEVEEGKDAYLNYNRTLGEIAANTGLALDRVAGCFSALSPNSDYLGNLRSAKTVCVGYAGGKSESSCTVSTYKHNRAKAENLLPCQLQAILWLTWKRLNRIKINYDPFQELLFIETNRCKIYVPYELIGAYR